MQSVSSRIWTRVAVSISYDDNHYTTSTSYIIYLIYICKLDLALNNLEWLMCHKTKPNQTTVQPTKGVVGIYTPS